MSTLDLPMPNERFDGATVVASTWLRDDADDPPVTALLLLLEPSPPYYRVAEIEDRHGEWRKAFFEDFPNINPATKAYAENGGDY